MLRCTERGMKWPVWLLGASVVVQWHRGMDEFSFNGLLHRCYCGNWNPLIRQPCCLISFNACSVVFYFSVLILSLKSLQNLCLHTTALSPLSSCVDAKVHVDSSSCVGGRGGGSLHPSDEAADPAALQACGKSRQERFPIPQEALPQRNRVSTAHTAERLLLSLMVFLITHSVSLSAASPSHH